MSRLPDKTEILDWIRENPERSARRDIARAFGLKGGDRVELKALLRELEEDGEITRDRRRSRPRGHLPPVTILVVGDTDADGDLWAVPKDWDEDTEPPRVRVNPREGQRAPGPGDHVLAKVRPVRGDGVAWEARPIKVIGQGARRILGIYRTGPEGGRIVPVDKGTDKEWIVPAGAAAGAEEGELVEAEAAGRGPRLGLPRATVARRLGDPGQPRQVSLIAIHEHGIPYAFPDEVLAEAEAAEPAPPAGREDLRHLPLITIDPADARDHDDAVCAIADDDPANPGGWTVWVAIADVAWYVRPGSLLDREARRRGNSTYFPDRVAPMLPERLSTDLCSLVEGADRPCLAVALRLDRQGRKTGHRFTRAIMRSPVALAYEDAQRLASEGEDPLAQEVVQPLFAAWRAAHAARAERQPLDLDLPERQIVLTEDGRVESVRFRERLDAHRVIEDFMILANVAAAETLEAKKSPLLYRVHEEPSEDKLDALREAVEPLGLTLAKGQRLETRYLNDLLRAAAETENREAVNLSVLRAQTQAYYAPENFGHFGLALRRYAHFTSPIRRYADLVVHRALISALGLGEGGLARDEIGSLDATAEHISKTERRSMEAERDTADRYLAMFLKDRVGATFPGRITGVQKFGLFVKLDETGADGLVPVSSLGREYFRHDPESQTLTGEETGLTIGLGQRALVRLVEAAPITGGLILELLEVEGEARRLKRRRGGAPKRAAPGRERIARAKAARKARRKR